MSTESVIRNLHEWEEKVHDACAEILEYQIAEAENWARANRRWTDVTGQAAQGLKGTAEKTQDGARAVLSHTVQHGVYLELAHGRQFAIVLEAIHAKFSPQKLGKMMQALFGGAAKGIVSVTGKGNPE